MKKAMMQTVRILVFLILTAGMLTSAVAVGEKTGNQKSAVAQSNSQKDNKKSQNESVREVEKKAREKGAEEAEAERQKIIEEAITALRETQNAIAALDKGDKSAALAALEKAVGKLEIILARNPELKLAPVDVSVYTLDVYTDVEAVRKAVDKAIDLLKDGRVQDARALMSGLASEIVIEVANIPLATYPDAVRAVVPLIDQGKLDEAKAALIDVLNTLVVTRHIIPLPILRVEQMLPDAEKLAEKKDRSDEEQKKLESILKKIRSELELAEALGYGQKDDFKHFYAQLDKIAEKTGKGKFGKGFFDELKKALVDFRNKLYSSSDQGEK